MSGKEGRERNEHNNVDVTGWQADMAKSVLAECGVDRCVQLAKKGMVCCYCPNSGYLSTGGIPNQ